MQTRLKISGVARLTGVPQGTLRHDPAGDPANDLVEIQYPIERAE